MWCRRGLVLPSSLRNGVPHAAPKRMFMAKLVLEDGGKRKDVVVVNLPDARVDAVEIIVDLISCGEVDDSSPSSVQELKSLLKYWI